MSDTGIDFVRQQRDEAMHSVAMLLDERDALRDELAAAKLECGALRDDMEKAIAIMRDCMVRGGASAELIAEFDAAAGAK